MDLGMNPVCYNLAYLDRILSLAGLCLHGLLPQQYDWDTMVRGELSSRMSNQRIPIQLKRPFDQIGDSSAASSSSISRAFSSSDIGLDSIYSDDLFEDTTPSGDRGDLRDDDNYGGISMKLVWPTKEPAQRLDLVLHESQPGNKVPVPIPREDIHMNVLKNMTHAELVTFASRQAAQLRTKDEQLKECRKRLKSDKQRLRRLESTHQKLKDKYSILKNPQLEDLDVFRGRVRKLSWRGSISLGLRKAMAIASATMFPHAALLDTSRNTVTRCEVLADAFLIARSVLFNRLLRCMLQYIATTQRNNRTASAAGAGDVGGARNQTQSNQCEERALVPFEDPGCPTLNESQPQPQPYSVVGMNNTPDAFPLTVFTPHDSAMCRDLGLPDHDMHSKASPLMSCESDRTSSFALGCSSFCGDATNSSIWQRQKLQGLLTISAIMVNHEHLSGCVYDKAFKRLKAM